VYQTKNDKIFSLTPGVISKMDTKPKIKISVYRNHSNFNVPLNSGERLHWNLSI